MTNYLYTIHIGDISRNQDNKDNLIQNIHAYAWKICNTWYFWYCLVGWSSSNPAEKSISLTPWHYIVKINFVRITKMNQIHVSKSWFVSEQCTINITHKCIYIYKLFYIDIEIRNHAYFYLAIFDQKTLLIALQTKGWIFKSHKIISWSTMEQQDLHFDTYHTFCRSRPLWHNDNMFWKKEKTVGIHMLGLNIFPIY